MLSVDIYEVPTERTSPIFARAFLDGVLAAGDNARILVDYAGGNWAGFGSPTNWEYMQTAIRSGQDWWYGDHGYLLRNKFYRVTKNRYQHDGLGEVPDSSRFKALSIPIRSWKLNGTHILVCPQSDIFFGLHNQHNWLENTLQMLHKYTSRPIKVRYKRDRRPIRLDLENAWAVVTYTSNCAIDAILYGVPAFCTGQCVSSSMSLSDLSDIERPLRPKYRERWAALLAANQWTLDEIRSGNCWRAIR